MEQGMRGPNCVKFGDDIGPSSALASFVSDFRYIALETLAAQKRMVSKIAPPCKKGEG